MNKAIEVIRTVWGGDSTVVPPSPDTWVQPADHKALLGEMEYVKPTAEEDARFAVRVGTIAGIQTQIQSLKERGHAVGMILFWEPTTQTIRSMAVETAE